MEIECDFFGPFRDRVGTKTVVVDTDADAVGGLLAELEDAYPELAGRLRDGDELAGDVVVTLNGRHVQHQSGFETRLSDGDVLRVTNAVYGG
ncbi:ubiquitin-like small modifier protein 1 [Halobellus rufus]|uniref:ubiquitin-like small modifier protein 1 n=1 Tax=Halobellus rufus TaxID=1448860 RepID=UPI000678D31E|nr:ubiquitin-like small modifier protein 1 [Halobellus rufus]